jgi:hypothetical protein
VSVPLLGTLLRHINLIQACSVLLVTESLRLKSAYQLERRPSTCEPQNPNEGGTKSEKTGDYLILPSAYWWQTGAMRVIRMN